LTINIYNDEYSCISMIKRLINVRSQTMLICISNGRQIFQIILNFRWSKQSKQRASARCVQLKSIFVIILF